MLHPTFLQVIDGGKMSTASTVKQDLVVSKSFELNGPNLKAIESVLMKGDLAELTIDQRILFYRTLCESLQLNWMTKPFGYIVLNGKLQLYAQKDCTDQLRRTFGVDIVDLQKDVSHGICTFTAKAKLPDGRTDQSSGVVAIDHLKGDQLANAIMKAETKAKRRVTLSICGLGMISDAETSSIPGAKVVDVSYAHEWHMNPEQRQTLLSAMKTNGWTGKDLVEFCKSFGKDKLTSEDEYRDALLAMSQSRPKEVSLASLHNAAMDSAVKAINKAQSEQIENEVWEWQNKKSLENYQ